MKTGHTLSIVLFALIIACQPQEERVPVPQVEIDTTPGAEAPAPTAACAAFKAALTDSLEARGLAAQYHLQGAAIQVRDKAHVGCLTAFDVQVLTVEQMANGQTVKPQFIVRRYEVGASDRPKRIHLHILDFDTQRGLVLVLHPATGAIQAVGVEEAS